MNPTFSIIIPVYNVAPYLRECLDSVLAQTYADWEAICVDDGSTDGSGAMLDEYAAKDSRFRVIHQANAGVSAARNVALELFSGAWVLFMDPDDYYTNNQVFSQFRDAIEKYDVNIIAGNFEAVNLSGEHRFFQRFPSYGVFDYRETQQQLGFTRYVYSRYLIKSHHLYFPILRQWEDPVFLVRALIAAGKYATIDTLVYSYRIKDTESPVNWELDQGRPLRDFLSGLISILDIAKDNNLTKLYRDTACCIGSRFALRQGAMYDMARRELEAFSNRLKSDGLIRLQEWRNISAQGLFSRESLPLRLVYLAKFFGFDGLMKMIVARVIFKFYK